MTAGAAVKLLGGEVSPFTARARMALELRGVAYELLDEPLGPKKSARLLAANPVYGKIPVLLLPDGRAICESAVIVQYAEDAATTTTAAGSAASAMLLPDDPYERAMDRFWTVFVDGELWPALDAVSLAPTLAARAKAADAARAALARLEEAFEARSRGAAFFSGRDDAPGLLDLGLGCFLPALWACERIHGVSLMGAADTPLLEGWSRRFAAHPAAKRVLPDTDKVVQFTRFLQKKFGVDDVPALNNTS